MRDQAKKDAGQELRKRADLKTSHGSLNPTQSGHGGRIAFEEVVQSLADDIALLRLSAS